MIHSSMKRANNFNQDVATEVIAIKRLIEISIVCAEVERI